VFDTPTMPKRTARFKNPAGASTHDMGTMVRK